MKKKEIIVPADVIYLSDWKDFELSLPKGKVILNKNICGCGCTEHYLRNDMPVILVSPRKELINCKLNSRRPRPLFYFDRSHSREPVNKTINKLHVYLSNTDNGFKPKILVTYDSLGIVLDALSNMGYLQYFTIIVDEFTCIFTDVKLKGFLELNMIHRLNCLPNDTVFISATPISEQYLDELNEFNYMPYVTLLWDEARYENVSIVRKKMQNTRSEIAKIIDSFRYNGYFKTKLIGGKQINSTEAVFFLNSVNDIVAVINKCSLKPDDTLVICADDSKNQTALNKVGFAIGHVPNVNEYRSKNKTFTFVTKCSFEGTDFYSDCSSTYIFADSNRDNLCLDISIDLPQIIGRCRTAANPFRLEVSYFYKTTEVEHIDVNEAKSKIEDKLKTTKVIIDQMKGITRREVIEKFSTAQVIDKYSKDYVEMQHMPDGSSRVVCNTLAYLADLRAIEIKSEQYRTTYSVLAYLENNGYDTMDFYSVQGNDVAVFYQQFMQDRNFTRRMKLYATTLEQRPELKASIESISEIPLKFKKYYNVLGFDRIKALSFQEADLEHDLNYIESSDLIRKRLIEYLEYGKAYTNSELKEILQSVYLSLNISKAAKAVDITKYIPTAYPTKVTDENGNRQRGYIIQ